jgi:hypothetical protein
MREVDCPEPVSEVAVVKQSHPLDLDAEGVLHGVR